MPNSPQIKQPESVRAARLLLLMVAACIAAHLVGRFVWGLDPHIRHDRLALVFDLDAERNVPTLFSGFLLLVGAFLFAIVGSAALTVGTASRVWFLLAAVFGFLAIDEVWQFHEQLTTPFRNKFQLSGPLYYAWVLPYGVGVLFLGALVLPTILRVPRPVRRWLFAAAGIYLTGAIGFEMCGAMCADIAARSETVPLTVKIARAIAVTCEESLEMVGVVTLLYALMRMLETEFSGVWRLWWKSVERAIGSAARPSR